MSTTQPVVVFCFGGRKANVELQMPFIRRILQRHPEVEFHMWDLAHNAEDSAYLRTLRGDRIRVMTQFSGIAPWKHFNDVYKFYTDPSWSEHLFVKLDDDMVFIETNRFLHFVDRIRENPDAVMSAKVVNNGACTYTIPGVQAQLEQMPVALLDVHMSADYALASHRYFFDRWQMLTSEAPELLPVHSWLSINLIGYDWAMGRRISEVIGGISPRYIADRRFMRGSIVGDEGGVNMFHCMIVQGFLACHLNFGPQGRGMRSELDILRKQYKDIGVDYLAGL